MIERMTMKLTGAIQSLGLGLSFRFLKISTTIYCSQLFKCISICIILFLSILHDIFWFALRYANGFLFRTIYTWWYSEGVRASMIRRYHGTLSMQLSSQIRIKVSFFLWNCAIRDYRVIWKLFSSAVTFRPNFI